MARYDKITEVDTIKEVQKFNPYHDKGTGKFTSPGAMGAFAPIMGRTENGQRLLDQYKEKNGGKIPGGAAAKPAEQKKPEDQKPKKYKKIDGNEANELAQKMGQTREQMGEDDYRRVTGWDGYFGTGNSFEINRSLREGTPLSDNNKEVVKTLDKYMQPSPEDIRLTRMVDKDFFNSLGITEDNYLSANGKVYANKGYSSTSYDISENVFTSRSVTLNIKAPAGTKMMVSPRRGWGDTPSEAEILLARNTAMKITGITKGSDGWGGDLYNVSCEVIVLD